MRLLIDTYIVAGRIVMCGIGRILKPDILVYTIHAKNDYKPMDIKAS